MGLRDFFRRPPKTTPAVREVAPLLTELAGDGGFALPVVGESHYRRNFDRVCGKTAEGANNMIVQAVLVCECDNPHDPDAVRIDVEGLPVGHLSRAMAKKYRARLAAVSLDERPRSCRAMVRGGWDRGGDDQGEYGIRLDLDLTKGRLLRPDA
jgi:hypothetical protein